MNSYGDEPLNANGCRMMTTLPIVAESGDRREGYSVDAMCYNGEQSHLEAQVVLMLRLWYLIVGFFFGLFIGQLTSRNNTTAGQYQTGAGVRHVTAPPETPSDDLSVIDGIGPTYVRALHDLGIFTFAQLAAQFPDDLAERMRSVRVTAERIRRERWIEQAQARSQS
jgi:predicted flap endonuclease-1-like 5' DNA nuclease